MDITIYRRDLYESKYYCPRSIFCHDMAFYLKDKIISQHSDMEKIGFFFRTDEESACNIELPKVNMDISRWGNETTPIMPFVNKIDGYDVINTDRLHVAIVACILGKKVNFYKGNYFKNEAVFKSSMKDYFKNVFLN